MSSPGAPAHAREPGGHRFPLSFARGAPLLALVAFGALHWMTLVEPAAPARAWAALLIALAITVALSGLRRVPRRIAVAGTGLVTVAAGAFALLAAGVPEEMLRPARWGALADGIQRGVEGIAGARVPYRGLDEWTRIALVLGGTALSVTAALLAFWPRRGGPTGFRAAALVVLVGLYVTPAVALEFPGEFVRGLLLTFLLLAFLHLERLRFADAGGAAATAVAAAAMALIAAPLLDRDEPWWDYETWALSAAESKSTTFSWEHAYGPLDWPRDGREVLRVKARQPAYWKAENLDWFDGARWRQGMPFGMRERGAWGAQLPDDRLTQKRWTQTIEVSIRNMRSRTFITAGTTRAVDMPRRITLPMGAGIYTTTRTLRRGDAYVAQVYTPRPSSRSLARARSEDRAWLRWYRAVVLPDSRRRAGAPERSGLLMVPAFEDTDESPVVVSRLGDGTPARAAIREDPLRRSWELAQRLRRQTSTPYGFTKAVERHLRRGYAYTETPDPRAQTLDGFLFDAKEGYCQQFSGAMALLLRLGGVPARVATGFTAGQEDKSSGEYVVRDLDAHSWVEVWFAGYGWVPFDPTPVDAPPRSQSRSDRAATAAVGDVTDLGSGEPLDPRTRLTPADEGPSPALLAALALAGAAAGAALAARRHRRVLDGTDELERALRRAGAPLSPRTTLHALEERFRGHPAAAAYVRAVRDSRYGGRAVATPTPAQRRALRAALSGAGILGRLRGWWALPPRRH